MLLFNILFTRPHPAATEMFERGNQEKKLQEAHSFFDENGKIKENYTLSEVKSQIENKSKEISIKLKLLESKMSDNRLDIKPVNDDLLAQYMFGVFIENLPSFILVI